mmetsp:Transcript_50578/g.130402  ORF Transcript_50578/g.130402 Transcript_50578/m.130402 type:complete len:579 (-) Transcript_50578:840-2576(-)
MDTIDDPQELQEAIALSLEGTPAEDKNLKSLIADGLRKKYSCPPLDNMRCTLGETLSMEDARSILFAPHTEELVQDFVNIMEFGPLDDSSKDLMIPWLSLLYLCHTKSCTFGKRFIEVGGLSVLSSLLGHPIDYARSQAFEALYRLTTEDTVDWFADDLSDSFKASLHDVSLNSPLLENISKELLTPSFPSALTLSLQLLGFTLSWVRRWYSNKGRIAVSTGILSALTAVSTNSEATQEEQSLAHTLLSDFGQNVVNHTDGEFSLSFLDGEQVLPSRSVLERAIIAKEEGNGLFKNSNLKAATRRYSYALRLTNACESIEEVRSLRKGVLNNLAITCHRMAGELKNCDAVSICLLLDQALEYADQSLRIDKRQPKPLFVKGRCLFEKSDFEAAAAAFREVHSLVPSDKQVTISLHEIEEKLALVRTADDEKNINPTKGVKGIPSEVQHTAKPFQYQTESVVTSREFEKRWDTLKASSDRLEFLEAIGDRLPALLSPIFSEALLLAVVKTTASADEAKTEIALKILERLSRVDRILLIVAFLTRRQREELKLAIEIITKSATMSSAGLKALMNELSGKE